MVREDLINSAVTFLRDPGVATSPLDKRIAFLQSKNLTQKEIDTALARAGENPSSANTTRAQGSYTPDYGSPNQQSGYGGYQAGYWQQQQPPIILRRDWRDWFIMATMMGGVTYGLYIIAKRYISPLIAPPTPPQLEQDKKAIEESFNKAFALLDQLTTDTEALKASEQARTERLDSALKEVESVMGELKTASRRREDEARRISDDVRGLKDLIPRAMESQKENTDGRLKELNMELKSLKTLVSTRMGWGSKSTTGAGEAASSSSNENVSGGPAGSTTNQGNGSRIPAPNLTGVEQRGSSSPGLTGTGNTVNRATIPAWQMAAFSKASGTGDSTDS